MSARPTTPNALKLTVEAGGFVLSCACLWLRFFATQVAAADGGREHAKKCKVAGGEGGE